MLAEELYRIPCLDWNGPVKKVTEDSKSVNANDFVFTLVYLVIIEPPKPGLQFYLKSTRRIYT